MTTDQKRPLCCTPPGGRRFWFATFLILCGIGLLLRELFPVLQPHHTALLLGAAGLACLINSAWNRTFQCVIIGPLLLLVAAYLIISRSTGWQVADGILWAVILIVVGAALLLKQRFAQ